MDTFKKGQLVTKVAYEGAPLRLLTVTNIDKRKMTLSDGGKWLLSGCRPYGIGDGYYRGPSIRSAEPTDDEQIRSKNLARWLGKVQWDALSLKTLREVRDLIRPELVETGPAGSTDEKTGT